MIDREMKEKTGFEWAPKVSPQALVRLYEMEARGLADEALVEEVGYALYARCVSIYRVTERLCPDCGGELQGVAESSERSRVISCPVCGWYATWSAYHASYKGKRIHGGRAYPFFMAYMERYPKCKEFSQKMLEIDRLIHQVHESTGNPWTLPAAVNLIKGKWDEIAGILDRLAYGEHIPEARKQQRALFFEQIKESEKLVQDHLEALQRKRESRSSKSNP